MPLAFTKNMGQWPDSILFRASGGGATMWFTRDGIHYQYFRRVSKAGAEGSAGMTGRRSSNDLPDKFRDQPDSIETTMIKAEFAGADPAVEVICLEELDYKCNYFIGDDPSKWRSDVPNYSGFTLRGLYPGVDVSFRGKNGAMEYELVSARAADLAQVQVVYRGAEAVTNQADGTALVSTTFGDRLFTGIVPFSSSLSISQRPSMSPASPDGISLVYSTYLGGSDDDHGYSIAVDGSGSAYVTGWTGSTNFPTLNPYQTDPTGYDVFVTKLSPSGSSLVYSTYLGGSNDDFGRSIAVDGSGSTYVTGFTISTDFPTLNPYQTYQASGDAFVTKLSPSGNSLVYSTYLGGNDYEEGRSIAVDGGGSAYVTGSTWSTDFPTLNPYQTDQDGDDVFVTKLSPSGGSLVYSTYLGGGGDDDGLSIAVDDSGSAYVTGTTESTDFPTLNPLQTDQTDYDVFITQLSPSGSDLVYSTYLGGSSDDYGNSIAVDGSGLGLCHGLYGFNQFPEPQPVSDRSDGC